MPDPFWNWCAMPGAGRSSALAVEENAYGDGYKHRATRGLNPVRPKWDLNFPFTSLTDLDAMDQFLRANALAGFWMRPPDALADVFVTVDEWSAQIVDKTATGEKVGTLQVTFTRCFNPQPPPFP